VIHRFFLAVGHDKFFSWQSRQEKIYSVLIFVWLLVERSSLPCTYLGEKWWRSSKISKKVGYKDRCTGAVNLFF
jgi:hypothetical protein